MESHNAVLSAFKPYFKIMQILGLFPFIVKESMYLKLETKFSLSKFCITIVTLLISLIMFGLALFGASQFDYDYSAAVYWKFILYITFAIALTQIIIQILFSRKIVEIVEDLIKFNFGLMRSGISTYNFIRFQNQCKKVSVITTVMTSIILICCLSIIVYTMLSGVGWRYVVFIHWGFSFEQFHGCFNATQFFIFTWLTSQGFECLLSHLKVSKSKLTPENLRKISALFYQLGLVIKSLNGSLCELLNFTLAITFLNEVFSIYSFFMTTYYYGEDLTFQILFSSSLWFYVHFMRKIFISYGGSKIKTAIESLKEFVLHLINTITDEYLKNELRCMLFQMECGVQNVQNSIFVIDWKLAFMVSVTS